MCAQTATAALVHDIRDRVLGVGSVPDDVATGPEVYDPATTPVNAKLRSTFVLGLAFGEGFANPLKPGRNISVHNAHRTTSPSWHVRSYPFSRYFHFFC